MSQTSLLCSNRPLSLYSFLLFFPVISPSFPLPAPLLHPSFLASSQLAFSSCSSLDTFILLLCFFPFPLLLISFLHLHLYHLPLLYFFTFTLFSFKIPRCLFAGLPSLLFFFSKLKFEYERVCNNIYCILYITVAWRTV